MTNQLMLKTNIKCQNQCMYQKAEDSKSTYLESDASEVVSSKKETKI